jgi:hypothetical protein
MGYVTNQNVNLQLMILLNFTIHHSCMIWGGGGEGDTTNKLQFKYGQILIS